MPPQNSFPPSTSLSFNADSTLGALLVGTLLSFVLFGVTTTQTYFYSGRFPNDSRNMKLLVACVWTLELGHVICIGHTLYVLAVTDFDHPERLSMFPQSMGASTLFNALVAMCVQGYFSFRIYRLGKRLYIPLLTWTLSFLFLGGSTVIFAVGQRTVSFSLFDARWGWLFDTLWAVAAANDLIIAVVLVFWLVKKRDESEYMTHVLDKIIAWTIETGVITSAAAIMNLICFMTMKDSFVWIAWYVVTARLYSNSFLASLNSRGTLRTTTQISVSKPYPFFSSDRSVNNETSDTFVTPVSEISNTALMKSRNSYITPANKRGDRLFCA
ncbi:hypothetical protein K438DRAFT_1804846 [Mycena galopus ATCC 62051]|nr:hypothetical protein K438DRAFT_1804846 [Mycena galopus ATCC 62051]